MIPKNSKKNSTFLSPNVHLWIIKLLTSSRLTKLFRIRSSRKPQPASPGHVTNLRRRLGEPQASDPFAVWLEEVERLPAMPQMCPLAISVVALTVLHAVNASPEIHGVALRFEEREPLDVDWFSTQLIKGLKDVEEFLEEKIRRISVGSISRVLPEIAYSIAGIAAGHENLLQQNVIYLRIFEGSVDAYKGRFVDGDFEVNQTFETLKLDFHQAVEELAMQNLLSLRQRSSVSGICWCCSAPTAMRFKKDLQISALIII